MLERESIGRRVKGKYLCEDAIPECEEVDEEDVLGEDEVEVDGEVLSEGNDLNTEESTFEQWIDQDCDDLVMTLIRKMLSM